MALRLTKTSKIIFAISIVVLSVALGYLVWRVNQEETTAPTETEAGDCSMYEDCHWHSFMQRCTGTGGCIENPGSCPSGTELVSNGDGYEMCCDPCDTGSGTGDYIYTNKTACQVDADIRNTQLDPNYLDNPDNCPDTGTKWVCASVDGGYTLDLVSCTAEEPILNCGTEPTTYPFNKVPTTIGPFTKGGTVVLYYTSLLDAGYRPELTFTHNGGTHVVKIPDLDENKRARVETNIKVAAGDTITLIKSDDDRDQGDPECAPAESVNPKYLSWGWIAPSGGECGSGLAGPPTGGVSGDSMDKVAVLTSSYNSWVQGFDDEPVVSTNGSQCWADWREWPGDYDFNDYFLQIAYVTEDVIVEEEEPVWGITKSVVESCLDEGTEDPVAQLTYTITVRNTGDGDGTIEKITDNLDSKVLAGFVQTGITSPGAYSNGTIVWDYTGTPLNIAAGSTKTYTYTILIDKDSFGVYGNTVTLDPSVGENVTASTSINADCDVSIPEDPVTPEETIPQTGIFDSTVGRVSVGLILVILGGIVYSMPNGIFRIQKNTYKYRERFERKVAKK